MSELRFEKFRIRGAELGPENCLADIMSNDYIHSKIGVSDNLTAEEKKNVGKGMLNTILPYMMQDGYNRDRKELALNGAVLENDYLIATFVPQLGGRLWSLFDKKAGKELLYRNDVFQPAQLALRDAWFSGGVEWNIGIKGHTPLTCSQLFAGKQTDKNGEPMLKMYEFERVREVAYSITAKLDGPLLLMNINIENTADCDTYMYWWSNIAVPETAKTRVIVPANKAFYCAYSENGYALDKTNIPMLDGMDASYAVNFNRSRDLFYDIKKDEDKWIAALDKDGYGLVQLSDPLLIGRKMFVWGQGSGGRHWNKWLSDCGKPYIEIQAGLMQTQLEHFVMPAKSSLAWREAYGAMSVDSAVVHGEFQTAVNVVGNKMDSYQARLFASDFTADDFTQVYAGSGWGYVQNQIAKTPVSKTLNFPASSVTGAQRPWLTLLETGNLAECSPDEIIPSYVKGAFWEEKLKHSAENWLQQYQLGNVIYERGDVDAAEQCYLRSIALCENAWSYRNLAQIERKIRMNAQKAAMYIEKAVAIKGDYRPLLVNCGEILCEAKCYESWVSRYEALGEPLHGDGRLKMLYSMALCGLGRYEEAAAVLKNNFVMYNIREGEYSLSNLWVSICRGVLSEKDAGKQYSDEEVLAAYPLPEYLDYRMH